MLKQQRREEKKQSRQEHRAGSRGAGGDALSEREKWEQRSAVRAAAAQTPLFGDRGGSKAANAPVTLNKVVPEWSGSSTDLGIGAAVGMACGFTIGTTISTATKTAVSLTTFVISQTAFAFGLSRIAANLGLITIHWERFAFLGWKVFRVLDVDGDGKLTQMDFNLGATRVLPSPLRRKFFKMLDVDG